MRLHFLAFWPCGPSFPCIFLVGFHFLPFWPFRGLLLGPPPPQVAKNGPFAQRPYNGFISAVTGSILQFLAFWAFIFLHFGLVGLYFLAFWPFGLSFPCILALWAFISFHFGLVGLHFLAFLPCGPSFPCILALWAFISFYFGIFGVSFWGPPASCQKWPVCPTSLQWIYQCRDRLHFAVSSLLGLHFLHFSLVGLHFFAFWPCAFISLHFCLVGLHFLAFWPCGPLIPFILAFSGSASGPPPQVAKNGPIAQRPYNGYISAVTGSILQFLAFWAFISLRFCFVGLYFLAVWPFGLSFPCILALWAFISFYFSRVGLHVPVKWCMGPGMYG